MPDQADDEIGRVGRPHERQREHPDGDPADRDREAEAQARLARMERSDRPGRRSLGRGKHGVAPHEADAEK